MLRRSNEPLRLSRCETIMPGRKRGPRRLLGGILIVAGLSFAMPRYARGDYIVHDLFAQKFPATGSIPLDFVNGQVVDAGTYVYTSNTGPTALAVPSYISTTVNSTDGVHQVGYATNATPTMQGFSHAFLWSGTAASAVDLTPAAATWAEAYSVSGNQQAGIALVNGKGLPYVWNGTAASGQALDSGPFIFAAANATNGSRQVGYGRVQFNSDPHALLWNGVGSSVIDLNPIGYFRSTANELGTTQIVGMGLKPADYVIPRSTVLPPTTPSLTRRTTRSRSVKPMIVRCCGWEPPRQRSTCRIFCLWVFRSTIGPTLTVSMPRGMSSAPPNTAMATGMRSNGRRRRNLRRWRCSESASVRR
jgi:hypothetical protein